MSKKNIITAILLSLVLFACGKSKTDLNQSPAGVLPTVTKVLQEDKIYQVDMAKSKVSWKLDKYTGVIKIKSAELKQNQEGKLSGRIVLDMESIGFAYSGENILDVKNYPDAIFDLKNIQRLGSSYNLEADITVKDKTNPVQMTVNILGPKTFRTQVNLDRTLWNIQYMSSKFFENLGEKQLPDQVEITAILVLK